MNINIKRICIVSQSHLCRNPRILKEAKALTAAGYQVTIITGIYSTELHQEDLSLLANTGILYKIYSDLSRQTLQTFKIRAIKKLGLFLERLGVESRYSLGYNAGRLTKVLQVQESDLYIMHQELATVIGSKLLQKHKVAFDLEDWYSEDLLPEARATRPLALLKKAETVALKNSAYCTTTSVSMAQKLADTYGCKKPDVVYNAFPSIDVISAEKQFVHPLKLFWFSQTIGPGRGLEEFISLLNRVPSMLELHLLGNISGDYQEMLIALMPTQHRIVFHSIVSSEELPAKIAEFDIGLALELTSPPSRNYTITNKFFQYIGSGLPVIATETEGQMEMFQQFKPGLLLPQKASEEDIDRLIQWLGNAEGLKLARQQALEAAGFFSWEQQAKKIIRLVEQALGTGC